MSIQKLLEIWVVSTFGYCSENSCMRFCVNMFLVLLYIFTGIQLNHMLTHCLTFLALQNHFPNLHYSTFFPVISKDSRFCPSSPTLTILYLFLFNCSECKWYPMILVCISLMTGDTDHLFYKLMGHVYALFGSLIFSIF